jgi:lipoprotein NlpI/transglutaminase-like putative cysteine protease
MYPSALALALACAPLAAGAAPSAKTGHASHHAGATHAATARGYLIEPAPTWVVPAAESPNAHVEAAPMDYRVIDEQVRAEGRNKISYLHVVRRVNDNAGLSRASQIQVQFDPSFQTLVLHQLDVVRNGRRLSQLHRKFPLLQRETQLERQMYDGRVTLSIVLDDVRAGDQIEYAYSVRGSNPVFDGKFVHQTWIGAEGAPVALYQVRLLAPLDRNIHHSAPGQDVTVTSRELGPWRETVFRRESVAPLHPEAGTPPSAYLAQRLEFSEFADWAEVARWGQALFAQNGSGPLLDQEVAQIKAQAATPAEQVRAALEFVQQQVRYFGTEIGANTHRPTSPDKVIAQRFGDCKDKVTLLAALLQRLGLQATPVLVNTALRGDVDRLLPSPLDFDHVIARVDLDGTAYYLDGTRNEQSGTLAHRQSTGLGKGLPLAADTQALAALPSAADSPRLTIKDTIVFSRIADDPTLESRITYHGELAEALRATLAARGSEVVARQLASTYLKVYPKARAAGAMQVEQSSDDDAVTFVQHFNVPGFWRFPEERALVGDEVAWGVAQALSYPKSESRAAPYLIELPGIYRHTVTVKLPEDVFAQAPAQHFEDGDSHLSLRVDQRGSKRESVFDTELHLQGGEVRPDEWAAYMSKVTSLEHHLQNVVVVPSVPKDKQDAAVQAMKAGAEQLRRDPHKYATDVQRGSSLKLLALSAQIDGGRLPPSLKAQALTDRGAAYDNLGRYAEAQADFAQALQLDADSRETLTGAAINAFNQGQFERAETFTAKVLAQDPHQSDALNAQALARYFRGDLAGAKADWQQMLTDSAAVRRGYPLVWLALDLRNAKQDPAPLASSYSADDLPTEWPRPLVDFALGKTTADAVIDAAKAAKNPTESLCEAYFYIGERYRADGDIAQARKYWQKSRDQGVVEYIEDAGSRLRLAQVQLAQK